MTDPIIFNDMNSRAVTLEYPSKLFPNARRVSGYYKANEMEHVGAALICYLIAAREQDNGGVDDASIRSIFTELGIQVKIEYDLVNETHSIIWGIEKTS